MHTAKLKAQSLIKHLQVVLNAEAYFSIVFDNPVMTLNVDDLIVRLDINIKNDMFDKACIIANVHDSNFSVDDWCVIFKYHYNDSFVNVLINCNL